MVLRSFSPDVLTAFGLSNERFEMLIGFGSMSIAFSSPDGILGVWGRWRASRGRRDRMEGSNAIPSTLGAVSTGSALELRGVTTMFGALAAISDVTQTVGPGDRRAVLGSNGAGKTTLFNCVTGDFLSTSGTIRLFGEDVANFPAHERIRRGLRRTYQISLLFTGLSVAAKCIWPAGGAVEAGLRRCARAGVTRC